MKTYQRTLTKALEINTLKNKDITKEKQKNWIEKYVLLYTMIVVIAVVIDNQQVTCGIVSHRKILI